MAIIARPARRKRAAVDRSGYDRILPGDIEKPRISGVSVSGMRRDTGDNPADFFHSGDTAATEVYHV